MSTVKQAIQNYEYSLQVNPDNDNDFLVSGAIGIMGGDGATAVTVAIVPVDNDDNDPDIITVVPPFFVPGTFRRFLVTGTDLGNPEAIVKVLYRNKPE